MLLLCLFLECLCEEKLFNTQILIRHGDKNPAYELKYNPNIPYDGELTTNGKKRHYNLGSQMRERYVNFIDNYTNGEFYFYSTGYHRTMQSLQSFLYGLLPPGHDMLLPNGTHPLPTEENVFPIHSQVDARDYLLLGFSSCPTALDLITKNLESKRWSDFITENKAFIGTLLTAMKTKADGIHLVEILDSLKSIILLDDPQYPPPEELTKDDQKKAIELINQMMKLSYPTDDQHYCEIAAGQFIEEVFFKNFAEDLVGYNATKPLYKKYRQYAAHDVTHINIDQCIGIPFKEETKTDFPNYASMLAIEAYIDDNTEHNASNPYIDFYTEFTPSINESIVLTKVTPSYCNGRCDLKTIQNHFININNTFSNNTWLTEYCGLENVVKAEEPSSSASLYLMVFFIVVTVGLVIVIAVIIIHTCYQRKYGSRYVELSQYNA